MNSCQRSGGRFCQAIVGAMNSGTSARKRLELQIDSESFLHENPYDRVAVHSDLDASSHPKTR